MTKTQLTVIDTVRKMEPEFAKALPKHIPSERFTRNAVTVINSNPELLDDNVDRRSLQASVMKAAQDGLVLDNREAALVTFKTKNSNLMQVQYIPMVAGILKKMRNTGEISTISTGLVYDEEFKQGRFEYTKGDNEFLRHEPILFGEKGDLVGVYAVVTLKDGSKIREFMDMKQIDKVKQSSRGGNSAYSPWAKWFEEMCVKSVLRKISKLCPMTSDLDKVFANEDNSEDYSGAGDEGKTPAVKTKAVDIVKKKRTSPTKSMQEEPPVVVDAEVIDAEFVDSNDYEEIEVDDDEIPA